MSNLLTFANAFAHTVATLSIEVGDPLQDDMLTNAPALILRNVDVANSLLSFWSAAKLCLFQDGMPDDFNEESLGIALAVHMLNAGDSFACKGLPTDAEQRLDYYASLCGELQVDFFNEGEGLSCDLAVIGLPNTFFSRLPAGVDPKIVPAVLKALGDLGTSCPVAVYSSGNVLIETESTFVYVGEDDLTEHFNLLTLGWDEGMPED